METLKLIALTLSVGAVWVAIMALIAVNDDRVRVRAELEQERQWECHELTGRRPEFEQKRYRVCSKPMEGRKI